MIKKLCRGRPTAAESLQNPWLRAHRAPHKARHSKVCFSTDKLKAYLKQKEEKRDQVRTKLQGPSFCQWRHDAKVTIVFLNEEENLQLFVLQVLLCVCQPGARLEKRLIFKSWCVLMSCFCVRLCFIVWGFILCVSGITCDHIRCARCCCMSWKVDQNVVLLLWQTDGHAWLCSSVSVKLI